MGQLLIGRHGAGEFENPYNFPLTISMTEPTPKAIGHIWVKSDAGSQINNIVIDDAFRESYPDGTLLLKESAKDEDYTLTCTKKDTGGVKRSFSYSRPCTDNTLNWTAGRLEKSDVICEIKHLYPLVYTKISNVIDITDAYVWTGTEWDTLCQKGSFLATGSAWDDPPAYGYVSTLNVFSISGNDFIYTPDTQIVAPYRGWSGLQFSPDGRYLIATRNMHRTDVTDPVVDGVHVYKRNGITFTDITNIFLKNVPYTSIAAGYSFSHDGKKFAFVNDAGSGQYGINFCSVIDGTCTDIMHYDVSGASVNAYSRILEWSKDDKFILIAINKPGNIYRIRMYNTVTGEYCDSIAPSGVTEGHTRAFFIGDSYDILIGTTGCRILRFDPATKSFSIVSETYDNSIAVGSQYIPSSATCKLSPQGKYFVKFTDSGAQNYFQQIIKIIPNGSAYVIKPIYSYAAVAARQGAIFTPEGGIVFYGRGAVDAFTVDPETDLVSVDTETGSKFNNKYSPFGSGYPDSMTYFNWNGVTM